MKMNLESPHLIEELFAVILVSNRDVLFEILRSNVLDQFILGFSHSVPNFRGRAAILGSSFPVEPCCSIGSIVNFSLRHKCISASKGYEMKRKYEMDLKNEYLLKEFDENVKREGIPCGMLIHLTLARPVVGNGYEVFEIFKLHLSKSPNAKQFGREIVLDMVVFRGPDTK